MTMAIIPESTSMPHCMIGLLPTSTDFPRSIMKTLIARLFTVWVELSQNWDTNEIATKKKSL